MLGRFSTRTDAGRMLGSRLRHYAGMPDVIVLALPRGGVPVAAEVARALAAPLDVLVVRKLGVPGREELAMGAVAGGGVLILNEDVIRECSVTDDQIEQVRATELAEVARREWCYRAGRPRADVEGKTVILVDDGLATGATMRAGVTVARRQGARRVAVAAPVGAADTCCRLQDEADEVVCLACPEPFSAIGSYYEEFPQLADADVRRFLASARGTVTAGTG